MSTQEKIVYKLLENNELDNFQDFIKKYWNKNHLFANEKSILEWQHKIKNRYHYMIAKKVDDLIGVQGVIPQSHFDEKLPENQIFLTLWKVLENKGIGIGLQLYENIIKQYLPKFIGVVGINEEVKSFYVWKKYVYGIMDHSVIISPYLKKFNIIKNPSGFKSKIDSINDNVSFKKLDHDDLRKSDTVKLYKHQLPIKSDQYLINRYMNHPVYKYDIYGVFKKKILKAICVIRAINRNESIALRMVDYIGSNKSFPLLRNFIKGILNKYKAEYVDFYSYGIDTLILKNAGFVLRSDIKELIVPNYFEPFVMKNIDMLYAYKNSIPFSKVRLFKGDGDQDRPNILTN